MLHDDLTRLFIAPPIDVAPMPPMAMFTSAPFDPFSPGSMFAHSGPKPTLPSRSWPYTYLAIGRCHLPTGSAGLLMTRGHGASPVCHISL